MPKAQGTSSFEVAAYQLPFLVHPCIQERESKVVENPQGEEVGKPGGAEIGHQGHLAVATHKGSIRYNLLGKDGEINCSC